MTNKVGSKGQIVIEKGIRDRLGIRPGYRAIQLLVDDHVELHFIPPDHNHSLMGILASHITRPIPESDDGWQVVKDMTWTEAVNDKKNLVDES